MTVYVSYEHLNSGIIFRDRDTKNLKFSIPING